MSEDVEKNVRRDSAFAGSGCAVVVLITLFIIGVAAGANWQKTLGVSAALAVCFG